MGRFALALLLVLTAAAAPRPSAPVPLGHFRFGAREVLLPAQVPSCAVFGKRLSHVKLLGLAGRTYVARLFLTYADGSAALVPVARILEPGAETPWIDLGVHGQIDSRCIAKMQIDGRGLGNGLPARMRALGMIESTAGHGENLPRPW